MRTVIKVARIFDVFDYLPIQSVNLSSSRYLKMSLFSEESLESSGSCEHFEQIKKIREFIPSLNEGLHKGQCGRIGVIGGSFEYTGAPYFAAISSLKLGADLVHVFCCQEAGPVIKTYSPELMVHPILDLSDPVGQIAPWLERLHALVIGPGLGRDEGILNNVGEIINHCKKMQPSPPLVIDADGLYLVTENTGLINDYPAPIILTPNRVEYRRWRDKMAGRTSVDMDSFSHVVVLLQKGAEDLITNAINPKSSLTNEFDLKCGVPGTYRRCGGLGDILSGCVGTFLAWLNIHLNYNGDVSFSKPRLEDPESKKVEYLRDSFRWHSLAAYAACTVTRTSSKLAYEKCGRGMTATDVISQIGKAYRYHFGA